MIEFDGVININKPEGWTSQDVCSKLKSRLHIRKIGHTGTLDPMATGVLPICTGRATRIIEYYDRDQKSYHAVMKLGIVTDTLDVTGEITETHSFSHVTESDVINAFNDYTGRITQIPPKYSALKINGKRAYDLAREGRDFEMKGRKIEIFGNNISRLDLENGEIEFDVTCSKGTYIRTICDDIGRTLGCGAAMSALTRTASGSFCIEDAVDINDLCRMEDEDIFNRFIPAETTLVNLGSIEINDNRVIAFTNGNSSRSGAFRVTGATHFDNTYKVYNRGTFLGVAAIEGNDLIPRKILISR